MISAKINNRMNHILIRGDTLRAAMCRMETGENRQREQRRIRREEHRMRCYNEDHEKTSPSEECCYAVPSSSSDPKDHIVKNGDEPINKLNSPEN